MPSFSSIKPIRRYPNRRRSWAISRMRCLISGQSGSRVRRTVFGSTRTNRQAPAYVPWPGSPHRCPWRKALPCAVVGVPSVLSQQVFQDHIIKHLIGQKSLQPGVFGLEALQFASVADVHPAKSGFPFIKSRRADPVKSYSLLTPADLFGLHPAFLFRQNRDDLVSGAAFAPQTVTYNSVNFDFLMPISLMMDSPFKQRTNRGAGHHLGLKKETPISRKIHTCGDVKSIPHVRRLHHEYVRIQFSMGTTHYPDSVKIEAHAKKSDSQKDSNSPYRFSAKSEDCWLES